MSELEKIKEMAKDLKSLDDVSYYPNCNYIYRRAEKLKSLGYIKQKWISVEERLPEKDGMYLIFSPYTNKEGGIVYCNRFLTKGNPIFPPNSFESISKVTHWMPLPEPPETKGETE